MWHENGVESVEQTNILVCSGGCSTLLTESVEPKIEVYDWMVK